MNLIRQILLLLCFTLHARADLGNGAEKEIRLAFASYSSSPEVARLLRVAQQNVATRHQRARFRGENERGDPVTYCYRAVKLDLLDARIVGHYLEHPLACEAGADLEQPQGSERQLFVNLLKLPHWAPLLRNRPKLAPKGAILVYEKYGCYSGGPAGHIEIKLGESGVGGYISFKQATLLPANNLDRLLVGVYVLTRHMPSKHKHSEEQQAFQLAVESGVN